MQSRLCKTLSRYNKTLDNEYVKYILGEVFRKNGIVNFNSISRNDKDSHAIVSTEDGREVTVNINTNRVYVINRLEYYTEEIVITTAGDVSITRYEKRPKGLIISEITKEYHTADDKDSMVCTVFNEKRYALSSKKINELISEYCFSSFSQIQLDRFRKVYRNNIRCMIDDVADFKTLYNSHLTSHYSILFDEFQSEEYPQTAIHAFVGDMNISDFYQSVSPINSLEKIHDIYFGNINEECIDELGLITLGVMDKNAYDMHTKLGYTEAEDNLVGGSLIKKSPEYRICAKKCLADNYKKCKLFLLDPRNRKDVLDILSYSTLNDSAIKRVLKY